MISDAKIKTASVMYTEETLPPRILELRKKIRDDAYLDSAVQRIAQVLSSRLVENAGQMQLKR